jgi:RNA polymerase sigma factor (sigma-70 family)
MYARTISDAELIKQTRDGLISGFETLVRRYHPRCMRFANGTLNNREESEEAVQDAFLKVFANIDRFRGDAKFSTWLHKILYNVCMTRLRKRKNFVDVSVVEDRYDNRILDATINDTYAKNFEDMDLIDHITSVMDKLPERYKTVMHLFYIEEATMDEIAHIVHISRENVKVRLYRGRALLRGMVAERLEKDISL